MINLMPAGETRPSCEALAAFATQLETLLRSADFDPFANSQILQSFSVLDYQPEARFLDIVARRALAELQAGTLENASEGCVQLVGALAVHRHNHPEFMQVQPVQSMLARCHPCNWTPGGRSQLFLAAGTFVLRGHWQAVAQHAACLFGRAGFSCDHYDDSRIHAWLKVMTGSPGALGWDHVDARACRCKATM